MEIIIFILVSVAVNGLLILLHWSLRNFGMIKLDLDYDSWFFIMLVFGAAAVLVTLINLIDCVDDSYKGGLLEYIIRGGAVPTLYLIVINVRLLYLKLRDLDKRLVEKHRLKRY